MDADKLKGQPVEWSRCVAGRVELVDAGTNVSAKPPKSWSYRMKSNQPGTSVSSARSLGS